MIDTVAGRFLRDPLVVREEGGKPERLQMMRQQNLWLGVTLFQGVALDRHAATSDSNAA
jgi:hypothetical protein